MALDVVRFTISFRDAKGWIGRVSQYISGDGADATYYADVASIAQGIRTALIALTNAAYQSDSGVAFQTVARPVAYGTNAEYPAEWMKALMTWQDSAGQIHRYRIPAPKLVIFDTDGVTVLNDNTSTPIVNYVAAMKATQNTVYPSSRSGLALTNFIGGIQVDGRQPKRFNEFVKSSHLVQGEGE